VTAFCRAILYISAAYAVGRCLSVCLPRSCIVSKRVTISSNFSPSGSYTILVSIPNVTAIAKRGKIAIFDRYLALEAMTAGASNVVKISTVEQRYSTVASVYRPISRFISQMMQDRAIVTIWKANRKVSNGTSLNDLK